MSSPSGSSSSSFLRCVECGTAPLDQAQARVTCAACGAQYQSIGGVPVLLRLDNEVFSADKVGSKTASGFGSGFANRLRSAVPSGTWLTPEARSLVRRGSALVDGSRRRCLIIGSGDSPAAIQTLRSCYGDIVVTDVVLNPGVDYICDAHDLPFEDDSMDAVVITAVLEHVLSPQRVVSEISRVLRESGVVMSSTPFMQQVHMGSFDFQRFTELGHRWLFRNFHEVERGVSSSSGSALLWSLEYFLRSFCRRARMAQFASAFARLAFFWIKYTDGITYRKPGAYDSGGGYYFVGRNAKKPVITQRELLLQYRGNKR